MLQYDYTVAERFMRYVQVDTQSDPASNTFPSTEKQKDLSIVLQQELLAMGVKNAQMDEYGYVYATIPSNTSKKVPVVCFCSHVDTAPDCSGTNVKPILHKNYDGGDIVLPDDATQVITAKNYPYLAEKIGDDIITASGTTLLGSDDKSGVSIIMDMANYLAQHPEVKHGDIKILFTPDEEVGRGTAKVDLARLGAEFAYTLDGGPVGTFEDETFSADGLRITITGVPFHPGYAKGRLTNALKIAGEILAALPKTEFSPETTDGRDGFVHPVSLNGTAEAAVIDFIIRDFITANLAKHEERLKVIAETAMLQYPQAVMQVDVQEQYRNMKEVIDNYPNICRYAEEAYKRSGLTVKKEPIRGGTDGSRLSFMGLPCPNIFAGMYAIHSKHEFVSVQDMQKSVEVLVNLVQVYNEFTPE